MSISTVDGIGEAPLRRTLSMGDIQATSTRYSGVRDQLLSSSSTPADGHPFATIPTPPHSAVSPPRQSWAGPPLVAAAEHTPEDPPAVLSANGASHTAQERRYQSFYVKTAAFLGYGRGSTRTRKELISLIFNFSWTLTQIAAILTILALSAHLKSPTFPALTEWVACDRPLGVWSSIWVVRVVYSWSLGYWNWVRNRQARIRADLESSSTHVRNAPSSSTPNTTTLLPLGRNMSSTRTLPTSQDSPASTNASEPPRSILFSRLTLLSSFITLTWFLTAHVLIYTSLETCRHSSPHLWWLTFSILCIMYIMVLEIVILGVVVFIIAPILFLLWNIILICSGRHPLQHPTAIRPEIGKLPKPVVDRIPLVMYIPPPPEEFTKDAIRTPEPVYTYPPTTPILPAQKRRFKWWKRRLTSKGQNRDKDGQKGSEKGGGNVDEKVIEGQDDREEVVLWEENWEQGEYPFVRLEGNRAACAICLMDFEEPKRVRSSTKVEGKDDESTPGEDRGIEQLVREVPVEEIDETTEEPERLKLSDAGEGPQPLRLLACGHVFHKTCLDPWLEKVSGRCPVCQRAVELSQPGKKKGRGRGRGRR